MEKLAHFEIMNPPSKYVQVRKNKIDPDTGKLKETTHYLTYNLFFSQNVHWSVLRKIINYCKDFILPFFQHIPKMEKFHIHVIYYRPDDNFDLDNKVAFWLKIILDLMKTPSSKEIIKAQKYRSIIKTVEVIPDDSVRFIPKQTMEYKRGQHKMEIIIHGIKEEEQGKLF